MKMDKKYYRVHLIAGIVAYYGVSVRGDHDRHGDICSDDYSPGLYSYCEQGYYCCENNTKCCTDGFSVAAVVGIVMASIFLIGMCLFCSVLITKKKKLRPNQLVAPMNNPVSNVNQQHIYIGSYPNARGQTQHFIAPPYPYGQLPPPYGQPFQQGQAIPYSEVVPSAFPSSSGPIQPPPYCRDDQAAPPAYKPEP